MTTPFSSLLQPRSPPEGAELALFRQMMKQAGGNPETAFLAVLAEMNEGFGVRLSEMEEQAQARIHAAAACGAPSARDCPHAEESAEMAVRKVFNIMGVDVDDPALVEEFRMDLRFGRTARRALDKGMLAVAALVAVALASAVWVGITQNIRGGGH